MDFSNNIIFLDGVVSYGETLEKTDDTSSTSDTTATTQVPSQSTSQNSSGGGFWITIIWIYLIIFAMMWFFSIRPNKKRQNKALSMIESIKAGDEVVTSGGLFGKIASIGGDCFLVEFGTNKSVIIPVSKYDIAGVKKPKISTVPDKLTEEPETKKEKKKKEKEKEKQDKDNKEKQDNKQ